MLKKHIKTAILLFSLAFFIFSSASALAETPADKSNYGLEETVEKNPTNKAAFLTPADNTPEKLAGRIVGVVLSFVGVIFFLLIFYSGLRWMMAQGDEGTIDKAKQTIIAATTGLVIVLAAYAITAFIGGQLTNSGK